MDAATKREIDDLQTSIARFEAEEEQLQKELQRVRQFKNQAMEKLRQLSDDEEYQQDMLSLVYEQRRKK